MSELEELEVIDAVSTDEDEVVIELEAEMKGEEAQQFVDRLLQHRCKNLKLDASNVAKIDTPCFEILLSAAKLWQTDGYQISYGDVPETFSASAELLGLSMSNFEVLEAQQ